MAYVETKRQRRERMEDETKSTFWTDSFRPIFLTLMLGAIVLLLVHKLHSPFGSFFFTLLFIVVCLLSIGGYLIGLREKHKRNRVTVTPLGGTTKKNTPPKPKPLGETEKWVGVGFVVLILFLLV
ncbi:MAG TPA: hypothetical protein VG917_03880 [Patescibacteria group bacterium]|nr:hypothetical protein [Patescibacteria group bacterium]